MSKKNIEHTAFQDVVTLSFTESDFIYVNQKKKKKDRGQRNEMN